MNNLDEYGRGKWNALTELQEHLRNLMHDANKAKFNGNTHKRAHLSGVKTTLKKILDRIEVKKRRVGA